MKKFLLAVSVLLLSVMFALSSEAANPPEWEKACDYYFARNGKHRDYKEAVRWFKAVGNYAEPNFYIGEIYQSGGFGVEKDEKEAAKYYKKAIPQLKSAANKGDAWGIARLGYLYQSGFGTEMKHDEAVKWLKKGVQVNNVMALYYLAFAYQKGLGVDKDINEAIRLYKRSAGQKGYGAMRELAKIYRSGDGVDRDYAEAIRWATNGAEVGAPGGMLMLGEMHENGEGVPPDKEKAIEWYKKAAEKGDEEAKKSLKRLGVE